ncbi:MAG TPA: TetR/AcrR family transcriptional regulator [Bacteroidales bacterium]|nr:TetR/AcrR family transcriptional regulator [Bacteroidales bacterium]
MPRTPAQIDEIRKKRKSHIMDIALDLFASEGYGHVSIAMLAKKAGISKGLMYNYFDSKEALLKALINKGIEEIMAFFDPNHDGVLTKDEFKLFVQKTFQILHEKRDYFMRFFGLMIQPNVKNLIRESGMMQYMVENLSVFEDYFRNQGFEDPAMEVFQFSVMIEGFGIMMLYYDDLAEFPGELFKKLENRIIELYT